MSSHDAPSPAVIVEIDRLAGKLDTLASRDAARRIFGADAHAYRRRQVAEHELAGLEAELGHALPDGYRQWMLRIGAGAGPCYGLWAPADASKHIGMSEVGRGGCVLDPSHIVGEHFEAMARRLRDGIAPGDACISTDTIRGAVPVGHLGCDAYVYLVVAGAFAGRMLEECGDCIGEPWTAAAAFRPPSTTGTIEPPTFLAWFEDWLDKSLAEVGEGG